MTSASDSFSDILACWHKIEFFIPFDLKQVKEKKTETQYPVYILPDAPKVPADYPPPKGKISQGATLFLGLFDKDEVRRVSDKLDAETEFSRLDREERSDDDSASDQYNAVSTCMAKIRLGTSGEPDFTSVEVSTLPWAIGQTLKHSLSALSWNAFENDKLRLQRQLASFGEERRLTSSLQDPTAPLPLAPEENRNPPEHLL